MMDFDNVLSIATQNRGVGGVQKRYSLQAGPPKKDPKSKGVNPAAVQALLQKRQTEAKIKETELKKQKEDLLAKRVELKSDRKARAMASRTKDNFRGYNGVPLVDVPKKRQPRGHAEPDGNGLEFHRPFAEPEYDDEDEEAPSDPAEDPEPPVRKAGGGGGGGGHLKSASATAPPRMNFADLLKLAEKKQHEPVELKAAAAKKERLRTAQELKELELERKARNRQRRPDGGGRPAPDAELKDAKAQKPDPTKATGKKPPPREREGGRMPSAPPPREREGGRMLSAPPPREREGGRTSRPPKANAPFPVPKESGVHGRPKILPGKDVQPSPSRTKAGPVSARPERRREAEKSAPKAAAGVRGPPGAAGVRTLPGAGGVRTLPGAAGVRTLPGAAGVRTLPGAAGVRTLPGAGGVRGPPTVGGLRAAEGRGSGPGRPRCPPASRSVSSGNVQPLRGAGVPSRPGLPQRPPNRPPQRPLDRPPGPPLPPITIAYKRRYEEEEEEEEYDSEMDDFIDDGGDEQAEVSKHIKEIFGYDRNKYKEESDYALKFMESSWRDLQKEEAQSLKLAVQEDLEEEKKEQEEMKRMAAKRSRKN
ncbi:protein SPT2 homolog isoform X2 [Stigmatopora argus]